MIKFICIKYPEQEFYYNIILLTNFFKKFDEENGEKLVKMYFL